MRSFRPDCLGEIPLSTSRQPDSSRIGPATPSYACPAPWLTGFWKGSMPRLATDMEAAQALVLKAGSACARRCPVAFAEGRWHPQGLGVAICLQRQMQQESSPGSDRIAQRGTKRVRLHSSWRPLRPTASAHLWRCGSPRPPPGRGWMAPPLRSLSGGSTQLLPP